MEKISDKQKRKNFEATVGSSENDMGPLPDTNKAKGIELKLGPSKKDKVTDLNPVAKKTGGNVKCMARGGGIEVRGKTKGRIC
jgi:hypothetical protein